MVCKSSNVTVDKFKSLASWGLLIGLVFFVEVSVSFVMEALSFRTVLLRRLVAWEDAKRGVVPADAVFRKATPGTSGISVDAALLAKRDGAATKAADAD
jgi:hypothetical protein